VSRHAINGLNSRKSKASGFPWLRVSFFILACGFVIIASGPLPEKIYRKWQGREKPKLVEPASRPAPEDGPDSISEPKPVPAPKPPVVPPVKKPIVPPVAKAPTDHTASSGGDIRKMSKGFKLETKVTVEKGDLASKERNRDTSYTATYELKIKVPKPSTTFESLQKVSPKLGEIFPDLKDMLPKAEFSRFF
jgi:hypothetical protein